jgi:hypothetical protein
MPAKPPSADALVFDSSDPHVITVLSCSTILASFGAASGMRTVIPPTAMTASDVHNACQVFWPMAVTLIVVPVAVVLDSLWLGPLVLLPILFVPRIWWTCIFGLVNWMTLVGGIVACAVPLVTGMF